MRPIRYSDSAFSQSKRNPSMVYPHIQYEGPAHRPDTEKRDRKQRNVDAAETKAVDHGTPAEVKYLTRIKLP